MKAGEAKRQQGANSVRGVVYALLSAVFFSLGGVLIKSIPWSAFSISGARSVFAAVVLYVYLRMQGKRLTLNAQVLAGAATNFVMLQTFVASTKLTTAANAIVLQFTMPVWILLLSWLIFRERPQRSAVLACMVISAGIVLFFFDRLSADGLLGNILAIVSGITYAGVFMLKRMPSCDFESAAILSFIACAVCGIPALMSETVFTPTIFVQIAVLGVVQLSFAYIFLSKSLDLVTPVTAALTSTIEPILNPLMVAAVVGEVPGALSLLGAVFVLVGATAYNLYEARRKS